MKESEYKNAEVTVKEKVCVCEISTRSLEDYTLLFFSHVSEMLISEGQENTCMNSK